MHNPVLVDVTRGDLVESTHSGAFAVARANGEIVVSAGDLDRPIFPRSAIKAFQALPLLETGAADHYGFGDAELALACASHSGTPAHSTTASAMLQRAGLTHTALACGTHAPVHADTSLAMLKRGDVFSAVHNNCSGKHAGMVCTCAHQGEPVAGYLDITHPHQQRIAGVLADVCGDGFNAARHGIDGCSAPNWAIPLRALARGFARLVSGEQMSAERRRAGKRLVAACMARSDMVAGPDRLDTTAMAMLGGQLFMKTGAEGVYCGGFPTLGLGFAVKIDDGNKRGAEVVVEGLVQRFLPAAPALGALAPIRNWAGTTVGDLRLAEAMRRVLAH